MGRIGPIISAKLAFRSTARLPDVLILVVLFYHHNSSMQRFIPDPAGPIPLGVVWWGALGGVTISLTGVFRHPRDWDDAYNTWHIARPALGAVMGTVGYLIFVVVIQAVGQASTETGRGSPIFYLVAFLLGYREQVFRDMLRRAVDALIASSRGTDCAEHLSGPAVHSADRNESQCR